MIPPIDRKGPKGMVWPKFFLFISNKNTPTMDPRRKASRTAKRIKGKPRSNPIRNPNFKSPPPIPLPLVTNIKLPKNIAISVAPNKLNKTGSIK